MEIAKMIGGGGNFRLGRLEEFLISLVDQARDFAADQDTGLGKEANAAVRGFFNGRGAVELLDEHPVLRSWSFQDVESVITKPVDGFFISAFFGLLGHYPPDAISIPNTDALLPGKTSEWLMSHIGGVPGNITLGQRSPPTSAV